MKTIINYISSTILTTIVYYLGGLDMALKTLLILMVVDYITGICKSIVNKKVNPNGTSGTRATSGVSEGAMGKLKKILKKFC